MTYAELDARLDRLRALADDDEKAHGEEDKIWRDVLQAIADRRCDDPQALARLALDTKNIRFARWCA